jgi:hypothetical protein
MRTLIALLAAVFLFSACSRHKTPRASTTRTNKPEVAEQAKPVPRVPVISDVSRQFRDATKARIEDSQAVLLLANGSRTIVPLTALTTADLAWLTKLSQDNPLPKGKSSVTVVASTDPAKKTIQIAKTEGTLETVQLCPPNIIRDQIGGTCMIYARVHWLDIAGYYTDLGGIYKIINDTPPDTPWLSARYVAGLSSIMTDFKSKPVTHSMAPQDEPFDWARKQLRLGRPILAALPKEIWQALPSGFIAAHPWNGGSVGHQIVINGFTWDETTQKGSFHVINSWKELTEFDLSTDNAKGGLLVMEKSLSPVGETRTETVKEVVQKITLIKSVGSTNLYEVETNLGTRRVAAPDEEKIYSLVEQGQ